MKLRVVVPEILDELPAEDPRARRSRGDLRRIHRAMGTARLLARTLRALARARGAPPRRLLEVGAGDGSLLLRVARALGPAWRGAELTLLDRQDLLDDATRAGYAALGWRTTVVRAELQQWLDAPADARWDLGLATLFLHHFDDATLPGLLAGLAARTGAFVAVEPRRAPLARLGSRLVAALGANAVTREDAVTSVAAGFAGRELTAAWPARGWRREERAAFPFSQVFVAVRATGTDGDDGR